MSALPPIADKRTLASACLLRANSVVTLRSKTVPLFDHLIGAGQECLWDHKAERLGRVEIDDEIELGWLLDRNFGGFYPAQNLVHQPGGASEEVREICCIGHKTASFDQVPKTVHRRQSST